MPLPSRASVRECVAVKNTHTARPHFFQHEGSTVAAVAPSGRSFASLARPFLCSFFDGIALAVVGARGEAVEESSSGAPCPLQLHRGGVFALPLLDSFAGDEAGKVAARLFWWPRGRAAGRW